MKANNSAKWIADQKQELNWQALRTNALVDNFEKMFPDSNHNPKRAKVPFPERVHNGKSYGTYSPTNNDPYSEILAEAAVLAKQHGIQLGEDDHVTSATVTELATRDLLNDKQRRMLPNAIEEQYEESKAKMMQTFKNKAA